MDPTADSAPADRAALDAWATRWLLVLGGALLMGTLLPVVEESGGGWLGGGSRWNLIWPWEDAEERELDLVGGLYVPLALALAALAIAPWLRGLRRDVALAACVTGAYAATVVFGHGPLRTVLTALPIPMTRLVVQMTLAGTVIAVGNRLRRVHPAARTPRLMAGLGGCTMILAFFVPMGTRALLPLAPLLEPEARPLWLIALCQLGMLGYGVLGTLALWKGPASGLSRATTIVGRALLLAFPAALLLTSVVILEQEPLGSALPYVVGGLTRTICPVGILAVALTAWLAHALARHARGKS
jgi:hypothetical protein